MEGGGRSSFQPPSTGDRAAHQVHYCSAVYICIGAILLTHLFVYRFPELLVPFIVALALSGVLIALDVLTERGERLDVLRERERRSCREDDPGE